jgi:phi13 family phage major tail protein
MNDIKAYADDGIAESDKSFKSGTITLGVDNVTDDVQNLLLGHAVAGSEITASGADVVPYVGIGFYGAKKVSDVTYYRAIWLPKVQFSEPADANATKGESLAFGNHVLVGTIMLDASNNWKQEKTFALEADAIAYLNTKAGIPVSASGGLTALSLTGTGGTLAPSFLAGKLVYSFGGVSASSVTVTPTAANHTIKLYVDGVYSQDIVSGAASASISVTINVMKVLTLVAQEVGKASQTTTINVLKTS